MEEKKANLGIFFDIINKSLFFTSVRISDNEEFLNEILDMLTKINYNVDSILDYENIYYSALLLKKEDYVEIIDEFFKDPEISKLEKIITLNYNEGTDTVYIYEIVQEKPEDTIKKRKPRKTVEELQEDLNNAVKKEDYEKAAKLREQINKKLVKKPTSVKKKKG